MNSKQIKTSELKGQALSWAVAVAEDDDPYLWQINEPQGREKPIFMIRGRRRGTGPAYASSWGQGGPIIERERISLRAWDNTPLFHAYMPNSELWSEGPDPLTAAMRAYVTHKLGDSVEIPDYLVEVSCK